MKMSDDIWGKCVARTFNESGVDGWWIPQSEVDKIQSRLAKQAEVIALFQKALDEIRQDARDRHSHLASKILAKADEMLKG